MNRIIHLLPDRQAYQQRIERLERECNLLGLENARLRSQLSQADYAAQAATINERSARAGRHTEHIAWWECGALLFLGAVLGWVACVTKGGMP